MLQLQENAENGCWRWLRAIAFVGLSYSDTLRMLFIRHYNMPIEIGGPGNGLSEGSGKLGLTQQHEVLG
jgi:hypothetical protein